MNQSLSRRVWRLVPLVALMATGGCFATRGDVRILQGDIAAMRADVLKGQREQSEALALTQRLLAVASDSVAKISARTVTIQGDVRGELRVVREQLLQVQTLLGQSQATIARLRAEMEARNAMMVVAPAPVSGGEPVPSSGRGGSNRPAPAPPVPAASADTSTGVLAGPNQLYTTGRDQLLRGATATARMTFQELITNYPQSDYAADAQFWIAESLAKENNAAAADAAYAAVVSAYPTSAKAPTALYKRAQLVLKQGNTGLARQLFEQVVARFPRSDEAELATETLKTLR
jgi:tol-pal system protein YbgF